MKKMRDSSREKPAPAGSSWKAGGKFACGIIYCTNGENSVQHNPYTSTDVEVSTEKEPEGRLYVIGDFTICGNGIAAPYRSLRKPVRLPDAERSPVCRKQIDIVKEFLSDCRPTRWARNLLSPVSSDLKHWAENWAGRYISTGAAIVAALELNLVCVPTGKGSRNVFIGVHFDDVAARMAERGWYIARDHVTATRIKPPEPAPARQTDDPEWWAKWAKENGIDLGQYAEPDPEPPMPDPEPEPPPIFWEEIVEALGLSEAEEG
jgi:hypothetical protein